MGGGVTFSASPATISVPTGSVDFTHNGKFTIPQGIHIAKARLYGMDDYSNKYDITKFVAVTPNKTYRLQGKLPYEQPNYQEKFYGDPLLLNRDSFVYWVGSVADDDQDDADILKFTISWSPEINTHTPDVTDY